MRHGPVGAALRLVVAPSLARAREVGDARRRELQQRLEQEEARSKDEIVQAILTRAERTDAESAFHDALRAELEGHSLDELRHRDWLRHRYRQLRAGCVEHGLAALAGSRAPEPDNLRHSGVCSRQHHDHRHELNLGAVLVGNKRMFSAA